MLRAAGGSPITASPDDASSVSMSDPSQTNPTRKRKTPSSSTTTSRGVASLTKEQLEKKRANDREAQRAIRERTKAQIESLERRIQELTAQQPYQELQEAIRQKDAILAENLEIKRRLTSILQIIQPLVGAQGLTELATAAHGAFSFNAQHEGAHQFMSVEPLQHGQSHHTSTATSPQPPFPRQWQDGNNADGPRGWDPSVEALNKQRVDVQRGLELPESGERLSFNFLLDGQLNKNLPSTTPQPPPALYPPLSTPASWDRLPKNLPPTCPLDGILLRFLHSRQQENGLSHIHSGPAYPSVSSLLNPASQSPNVDPLSRVMTDIISKFPILTSLPDKVAVLLVMFWFMRWCLHPTLENYERLPEWMRPRPAQLFEAHPAFVDYVPWPEIRERLVADHANYPFDAWFIPYTTGLTVNWPYEATDCLLSTGDRESEPIVNPVFERHILRLENWSLGPEFQEAFPNLAKCARIKEKKAT